MSIEVVVPEYHIETKTPGVVEGHITHLNDTQYELVSPPKLPFLATETLTDGWFTRHPSFEIDLAGNEYPHPLKMNYGLNEELSTSLSELTHNFIEQLDQISDVPPTLESKNLLSPELWYSRWQLRTQIRPVSEKPQGLLELCKK